MKLFGKLAVFGLCGALCLGLTGCVYTPFDAARNAVHGVQRTVSNVFGGAWDFFFGPRHDGYDAWDEAAQDWEVHAEDWEDWALEWAQEWEDRAEDWEDTWDDAYDDIRTGMSGLSQIGGAIDAQENPDDRRSSYTHAGQGEASLRLEARNASNIILRQGGEDDTYRFEYDPSHFEVEPVSSGGVLTLSVKQLRFPDRHGKERSNNYKCYITVPARAFEKFQINASDAGFYIEGLASSFTLDADDSGFSISGCRGDLSIDASDCGFSVDLPRDFASSFRLVGSGLGFALGFSEGEPANLNVRADCDDGYIAAPDGWHNRSGSWKHKTGDGSVSVELSVSDSAGAITVG